MNTTISTKMSAVKKRLIASQTPNIASTSRAARVASSGKNGRVKVDDISGGSQGVGASLLAPAQQDDHQAQAHHAQDRAEADDVEGHGAVLPLHRVVMETVEQHLVERRAQVVVGGLDQPQ